MKKIRMIMLIAATSLFFTGCTSDLEDVKPAVEVDNAQLTGNGEDETDPPPPPTAN